MPVFLSLLSLRRILSTDQDMRSKDFQLNIVFWSCWEDERGEQKWIGRAWENHHHHHHHSCQPGNSVHHFTSKPDRPKQPTRLTTGATVYGPFACNFCPLVVWHPLLVTMCLDWLIVFYIICIALLPASEQTHCAPAASHSEWETVALHGIFWISTVVMFLEWCLVVTWLVLWLCVHPTTMDQFTGLFEATYLGCMSV